MRARGESNGRALADRPIAGRDVASHLRGVFAELSQRDATVLTLYESAKLWEHAVADKQASILAERLDNALAGHRDRLQSGLGRPGALSRFIAVIVTIGAALWFPIVQPILNIVLQNDITSISKQSVLLIVQLLGATYLVQSVGFLVIYFLSLWMWLRWRAYRLVDRALLRSTDAAHPAAVVMAWTDSLVAPLRQETEKLRSLSDRIAKLDTHDREAA